jgi:RND family efflux transporter MFP subunit
MSEIDLKLRAPSTAAAQPGASSAKKSRRLMEARRIVAVSVTLTTIVLAVLIGSAAWNAYMERPWTRDATVRSYVVTIAPEVSGRIVELPVADNQFVHKGDLLTVIDPIDYKIGVSLAEAAVEQAKATAENAAAESRRRQALTDLAATPEEKQAYAASALAAQAAYRHASGSLDQANVNLKWTRILSPVNGYVTNLLVQRGDYVNIGQKTISLVNAESFWVDGYFEEPAFQKFTIPTRPQSSCWGTIGSFEATLTASHVASTCPTRNLTLRDLLL